MTFRVLTLGCKTNQAESFKIERILCEAGFKLADISEKPDVCIINTCSVTTKADQQSRQLINKHLKNNIKVIVTGCYADLNRDKLQNSKTNITVIPNKDKLNLIGSIIQSQKERVEQHFHPRHRPAVKVQDGCNNACSYCIIPMTRGRSRSLPFDEIIDEIQYYESLNYKEIVFTGIHLGAFGADISPKTNLAQLLKNALRSTKSVRFRLSSLEVGEIDEELLEVFSEKRICKHLHIPLQSGDDKILKKMNRPYTINEYIAVIEKILNRFEILGIGTDVITGFPGESEEAFNNTKSLLELLPFSYLHIFQFSSRPGTKAANFPEQIDEKTKKARSFILRQIGETKKLSYLLRNIGKSKAVILENKSVSGFFGTSDDYIKVFVPDIYKLKEGMLISVIVDDIKESIAIGVPLIHLKKPHI